MMRQDRFTEGASFVILSGDGVRTGYQRSPRRNLGWGSRRSRGTMSVAERLRAT